MPPRKSQRPDASAADVLGNDTIPHTDENAPLTTRSDATDLGVPMKPAADPAAERVGPEDALGLEPTRGDYSDRLVNGPSVRMAPIADADRTRDQREEEIEVGDGTVTARADEPGPNVQPVVQVGAVQADGGAPAAAKSEDTGA